MRSPTVPRATLAMVLALLLVLPLLAAAPAAAQGNSAATITVVFSDDCTDFEVTSSKDISNIEFSFADSAKDFKDDGLTGRTYRYDGDDVIESIEVKSGTTDQRFVCTPTGPGTLQVVTTKAADRTSVTGTQDVTFTVAVRNPNAVAVTLTELVDQVQGASGAVDLFTAGLPGTCQGKDDAVIAAGATFSCTFTLTLSATPGGSHIDTATAVVTDGTRTASDQSDSVTVTYPGTPPGGAVDVDVLKQVIGSADGVFTFQATVRNDAAGPVTLSGLVDRVDGAAGDVDLFGTTNDSGLSDACADVADPITLAAGQAITCTFAVTITAAPGTTTTHVDRVIATVDDDPSGGDPAVDVPSNPVTVTVTAPPTTPPGPQVSVIKLVDQTTGISGSTFTYTATVRNDSSTTPVELDALVDRVDGATGDVDLFSSAANSGGASPCNGRATPITIAPGGSFSCTFVVTITGPSGTTHVDRVVATVDDSAPAAPITAESNVVTVTLGSTPPPPPPPPPPPGQQPADLSVTKTVDEDRVQLDDTATYGIVVANAGPGSTTATMTDEVPDGFRITSAQPSQGSCAFTDQLVQCSLGTIPAGSQVLVTVTAVAEEVGVFTNIAVVDGSAPDGNPGNDEDEAIVEVPDVGIGQICEPFDSGLTRIAGDTRIETAIEGAQALFCDGEATAVVLTRSDLFPDAQAGTPLAIRLDAPLLLSEPASLNPATEAEILRVLQPGGTVYLLGGNVALSDAVESRIRDLGFQTVRYGGENRYGTAAIIADRGMDDPATLLATNGDNFPDSVVAGAAALSAGNGSGLAAVVLTSEGRVPPETAAYLAGRQDDPTMIAIGGPATQAFPDAEPVFGDTRYTTSAAVAERFFDAPMIAGIATGVNFADALTGGAIIGRGDVGPGPMLLTDPLALSGPAADYLAANDGTIDAVAIFGGGAAIDQAVEDRIREILGM